MRGRLFFRDPDYAPFAGIAEGWEQIELPDRGKYRIGKDGGWKVDRVCALIMMGGYRSQMNRGQGTTALLTRLGEFPQIGFWTMWRLFFFFSKHVRFKRSR